MQAIVCSCILRKPKMVLLSQTPHQDIKNPSLDPSPRFAIEHIEELIWTQSEFLSSVRSAINQSEETRSLSSRGDRVSFPALVHLVELCLKVCAGLWAAKLESWRQQVCFDCERRVDQSNCH